MNKNKQLTGIIKCEEYLLYVKERGIEDEIRPTPLGILREFFVEDVDYVRPSHDWVYSENITFEVSASV